MLSNSHQQFWVASKPQLASQLPWLHRYPWGKADLLARHRCTHEKPWSSMPLASHLTPDIIHWVTKLNSTPCSPTHPGQSKSMHPQIWSRDALRWGEKHQKILEAVAWKLWMLHHLWTCYWSTQCTVLKESCPSCYRQPEISGAVLYTHTSSRLIGSTYNHFNDTLHLKKEPNSWKV